MSLEKRGRRRRLVAGACAAAVVAGCGSGSPAGQRHTSRIDGAQALELARVLLSDYSHYGSRLAGTDRVHGQTLVFDGAVDFRSERGRISLRQLALPAAAARTFYWTRTEVLAQAAPGSEDYLVGAEEPNGGIVDHLVAFIDLLSAPAIDNIELLENRRITFLGTRHRIDHFKEGRIDLWVGHTSDALVRVTIDSSNGSRIDVRLLTHQPEDIELPPRGRWRFATKR